MGLQIQLLDEFVRPLPGVPPRQPAQHAEDAQVLVHRKPIKQPGLLRNDANARLGLVGVRHRIDATHAHLARGRHEFRGDLPYQRGLARAVWAQHAQRFTPIDGERDVAVGLRTVLVAFV